MDHTLRASSHWAGLRARLGDTADSILSGPAPFHFPVPPTDPDLLAVVDQLRWCLGLQLEVHAELGGCVIDAGEPAWNATNGGGGFGPAPIVVFSSAGVPGDLVPALNAWCASFAGFGHKHVKTLLIDDGSPSASAHIDVAIERLRAETGVDLVRLAERDRSGGLGPKARWRRGLVGALPSESRRVAERLLAADAVGGANTAFLLTAGRPLVWIEQDALPSVPVTEATCASASAEWWEEIQATDVPTGLHWEPVDLLSIVDRLLYGPQSSTGFTVESPGWEDLDVGAADPWVSDLPDPLLCHFPAAGHADYRAIFSHLAAALADPTASGTASLLAGGLDRFRVARRQPATVRIGHSRSAFGTAVGFHPRRPLPAPFMPQTGIRLGDFAVGSLLRAAGPCPAVWAGTALAHRRGPTTSSGRGPLGAFLRAELLLWPTLHALEEILAVASPCTDASSWLAEAGRLLAVAGAEWRMTSEDARAGWLAQVGAVVAEARDPAQWRCHVQQMVRATLVDIGVQLQVWARLVDLTPAEDFIGELRWP